MKNKYYIYRNSTLEHIFKGEDCVFSSYGGVEKCNESDREIVVLYLLPYSYSENDIVAFAKEFLEKTTYIANSHPDKTIHTFSLFNYFYKPLAASNAAVEKIIKTTNEEISKLPNVRLIDISSFFTNRAEFFDEKYYYLYNTVVGPKIASAFREWAIDQITNNLTTARKKCLILDLDNTLWGGILGEDGVAGLKISGSYPGNAYHDFQTLSKEVAETGIILCTCSKNNERDVAECFKTRDDMVLKYDDFVIHSINWNSKVDSIKNIVKQLNIGLDSVVFIDDNPRERELIKSSLPEVLVPDFPQEPYELTSHFSPIFLKNFGCKQITDEDKNKKTQYEHMLKSNSLRQSFANENDFIRELKINLTIVKMDETNIARFSQLINKSNQFNLTTKRYSEDDLKKLERDGCRIYGLKISDKFGDLGISGIAIARINEDSADIDTLLMSCRALGRKIENEFLKAILNDLQKNNVKHVAGCYIPTKKNALVKDFYKQFGFKPTSNNNYSYEITEPIAMDDKYHMEEE